MHVYTTAALKYSKVLKLRQIIKKYPNPTPIVEHNLPLAKLLSWIMYKQTKISLILSKKNKNVFINNRFNKTIGLNNCTSKTTLMLHTFIFWNFYFNSLSSLFNKKSTSVANNINSLGALKRQLPRPVSKAFQKQKKIIAKANSGVMAEPILKTLISSNFIKDIKNKHILKHVKLVRLATFIVLGYSIHKNFKFKEKNGFGATNKSVFSLNQFTMENMINL